MPATLGHLGVRMDLQCGEWVRIDSGEVGRIVYISRLTIFVAFTVPGTNDRIDAFLESQLTRTDPPESERRNITTWRL
jgi:hypothetical protein